VATNENNKGLNLFLHKFRCKSEFGFEVSCEGPLVHETKVYKLLSLEQH